MGLQCLDILHYMQQNHSAMEEAFIFSESALDGTSFDAIFLVFWSQSGSNRYQKEVTTQTHWRDLLQDFEGTLCCAIRKSVLHNSCVVYLTPF